MRPLSFWTIGISPLLNRIRCIVHSTESTWQFSNPVPMLTAAASLSAVINLILYSLFSYHTVIQTISSNSNVHHLPSFNIGVSAVLSVCPSGPRVNANRLIILDPSPVSNSNRFAYLSSFVALVDPSTRYFATVSVHITATAVTVDYFTYLYSSVLLFWILLVLLPFSLSNTYSLFPSSGDPSSIALTSLVRSGPSALDWYSTSSLITALMVVVRTRGGHI